jgi:DNA-binding response OmpR family regulator
MNNNSPLILMIEDDPAIQDLNRKTLARRGIQTISAHTLSEARLMLSKSIDLILLDILLPDGNGLDFVPEIRAATAAPILILTSKREDEDIVQGLLGGGDDYMTKPFRNDELYARIIALLRRAQMAETRSREITKGRLKLDTVAGRAYLSDEDLQLAPKEFAVLHLLIKNEGKAVAARKLYEEVWKQPMACGDKPIKNVIYRLRKRLEEGNSEYTVAMYRGDGYCFEKI